MFTFIRSQVIARWNRHFMEAVNPGMPDQSFLKVFDCVLVVISYRLVNFLSLKSLGENVGMVSEIMASFRSRYVTEEN